MIVDRVTKQIAEFASRLVVASIPDSGMHAATQRFIDTMGCALAGHDCDAANIGRRLAAGQGPGKFPGRVMFHGDRVGAEAAAFINTAMIRRLDFNDRYPGGHPSDCLGALLALVGDAPYTGGQFLISMVVAYEIFARLSDAARLSRRGWDQGFAVAVSTVAGLCNLLRLTSDRTAQREASYAAF